MRKFQTKEKEIKKSVIPQEKKGKKHRTGKIKRKHSKKVDLNSCFKTFEDSTWEYDRGE